MLPCHTYRQIENKSQQLHSKHSFRQVLFCTCEPECIVILSLSPNLHIALLRGTLSLRTPKTVVPRGFETHVPPTYRINIIIHSYYLLLRANDLGG